MEFPHLYAKIFDGCGKDVFLDMYNKFRNQPIVIEKNAQIPEEWMDFWRITKLFQV